MILCSHLQESAPNVFSSAFILDYRMHYLVCLVGHVIFLNVLQTIQNILKLNLLESLSEGASLSLSDLGYYKSVAHGDFEFLSVSIE